MTESTENKPRRRRQYYVRGDIQGRYLRMIIVAACLPAFLISGCLFYLMAQLMAEELAIPDAIYAHLVPVLKQIGLIMIVGIPIIFIIIFLWGLIVSHRFAGPIHRLEEDLSRVAGGDYSVRVKFRKKDRLDSLASAVNKVLDLLERK